MTDKPYVIFLDHDPDDLDEYRRRLQKKCIEWDCSYFTSPREALVNYRAHPSAVLVTYAQMPGISGLEVLKIAKRFNPAALVVVISGEVEAHGVDMLSKALNAGAAKTFTKPVPIADLIKAIEELVGRI